MPHPGPNPATIRIYLAHGTPDGLRIVEKANWSGRALMCSRVQYPEVRKREEFDRTGVYLLLGPGERGSQPRIYVGEADIARDRLNHHFKGKDFWTSLVLFTANDENLNKAHVRYLEARLLELAQKAKRAEMENSTAPVKPPLSEADQADTEGFLQEMLLIYPLLGIQAFEPAAPKGRKRDRLLLKGRDAEAEGQDTAEGFVVFGGAKVRGDTVPSFHAYLEDQRKDLIRQGVLEGSADAGFRLSQDYVFSSPSTAASVVMGRNANGRIVWKDNSGRTLREIQEAAVGEDETPGSEGR